MSVRLIHEQFTPVPVPLDSVAALPPVEALMVMTFPEDPFATKPPVKVCVVPEVRVTDFPALTVRVVKVFEPATTVPAVGFIVKLK